MMVVEREPLQALIKRMVELDKQGRKDEAKMLQAEILGGLRKCVGC